jgi:hypothetical protein
MRTTVTLDPDVEQLLKATMHRRRKSFKQTLNEAIRRGLLPGTKSVTGESFKVKARPMGLRAGIDPTKLNQLADDMEIESYIKAVRRRDAK